MGELWSVFFDGETGEHVAAKQTHPLAECRFDSAAFAIRIAGSTLGPQSLVGRAGMIGWDLRYAGDEPPLYLLPKQACELAVQHKPAGEREVLRAEHRALFEILTDDRDHGIPIRA